MEEIDKCAIIGGSYKRIRAISQIEQGSKALESVVRVVVS